MKYHIDDNYDGKTVKEFISHTYISSKMLTRLKKYEKVRIP